MSRQMRLWGTAHRPLTATMMIFAAAYTLHGIDHFRRGMAASPPLIMVGGTIQGVIVTLALVLVLRDQLRAPQAAAAVGFGSAALFV